MVINSLAKENISPPSSAIFLKKALEDHKTGLIEISSYNAADDEISYSDPKCYKISNLTFNTYKSEQIFKSSARTEVALVESHNIVVSEMTQTLEKNKR